MPLNISGILKYVAGIRCAIDWKIFNYELKIYIVIEIITDKHIAAVLFPVIIDISTPKATILTTINKKIGIIYNI